MGTGLDYERYCSWCVILAAHFTRDRHSSGDHEVSCTTRRRHAENPAGNFMITNPADAERRSPALRTFEESPNRLDHAERAGFYGVSRALSA
jgi:hypothetical protein